MTTTQDVLNKVNANRSAYQTVIDELRAMGMDDAFISAFIDEGKAEDAVNKIVKRNTKRTK